MGRRWRSGGVEGEDWGGEEWRGEEWGGGVGRGRSGEVVGEMSVRWETFQHTVCAEQALPVHQEAYMAQLVTEGGVHCCLTYLGRKTCC